MAAAGSSVQKSEEEWRAILSPEQFRIIRQKGTEGKGKEMEAREKGLHQDDADEDDENVKQLQQCSSIYLLLQDCLVKTDRNWKSCQKEVQALKACNDRRKKDKST